MTMHVATRCLVVAVQSRMELDASLDEAVDLLKSTARTEKVGISVTRLAPRRNDARLRDEVPRGVTIEGGGAICDERASKRYLR